MKRFFDKTRRDDSGCLLWTGCVSGDGYGHFWLDGRMHPASRVAWVLEHGEIPRGLLVCHSCDTPLCVAIEHLFLGTPARNSRDMVSKGRQAHPRGERCGTSKLTRPQVDEIIWRVDHDGEVQSVVARAFGVTQSQVSRIVSGKAWAA